MPSLTPSNHIKSLPHTPSYRPAKMYSFGINALIFIIVAWFRIYQLMEFFMFGLAIGIAVGALIYGVGNHVRGGTVY